MRDSVFARDIGSCLGHGYAVERITVFDAVPLMHHTECVALLTRQAVTLRRDCEERVQSGVGNAVDSGSAPLPQTRYGGLRITG